MPGEETFSAEGLDGARPQDPGRGCAVAPAHRSPALGPRCLAAIPQVAGPQAALPHSGPEARAGWLGLWEGCPRLSCLPQSRVLFRARRYQPHAQGRNVGSWHPRHARTQILPWQPLSSPPPLATQACPLVPTPGAAASAGYLSVQACNSPQTSVEGGEGEASIPPGVTDAQLGSGP